jgi:hypothetical protein
MGHAPPVYPLVSHVVMLVLACLVLMDFMGIVVWLVLFHVRIVLVLMFVGVVCMDFIMRLGHALVVILRVWIVLAQVYVNLV